MSDLNVYKVTCRILGGEERMDYIRGLSKQRAEEIARLMDQDRDAKVERDPTWETE